MGHWKPKYTCPPWDGTRIVMIDNDYRPESLAKHGSYSLLGKREETVPTPHHEREIEANVRRVMTRRINFVCNKASFVVFTVIHGNTTKVFSPSCASI